MAQKRRTPTAELGERSRRPVTLKDVARAAGVDVARASVVLNGARSSAVVSEHAREAIIRAAAELGYKANPIGRWLSTGRTTIIGFYSGYGYFSARDHFLSEVVGGVQEGCVTQSMDLLLFSPRAAEDDLAASRRLTDGRVEGLVVWTPERPELMAALARSSVPVVVVANSAPGMPHVLVDDAAGGRLAAEHLAERGHRHVLYRRPPPGHASGELRCRAFLRTARRLGLEVVAARPADDAGYLSAEEKSLLTSSADHRPTAAACWSDHAAYHLLSFCGEVGIDVPGELAVVGFNGIDTGPSGVRLTTIRAPWAQVGRRAVELVCAMASGEAVPEKTTLPVELVAGGTT
jgi:DNA-binding LacI/PurR family transcriptional regulator